MSWRIVPLLETFWSCGSLRRFQDGEQDEQLEFAEGWTVAGGAHAHYVGIRRGESRKGCPAENWCLFALAGFGPDRLRALQPQANSPASRPREGHGGGLSAAAARIIDS
jgi:hypothetical protein